MLGNEQEPHQLQKSTEIFFAIVGGEEKAADLGRAVVLADQVQNLDFLVNLQRLGFEKLRLEAIGVKRFEPPHFGNDAAGADDFIGGKIFHDEQIALSAGAVGDVFHTALGFEDAFAEKIAVVRQSGEADARRGG